ncbi:Saccharopine dehydrogenase-domain-containing protein [Tribonema minus]|uniref:Saccharopine dehydrogenase-domain-containing protein n=1 Tax=Tribonema minus TaxID=303371 RepID=A0A835YKS6_9STRA|nr:Saccharopine dehydrogenase-domain-containing protein [Tribonema minus]
MVNTRSSGRPYNVVIYGASGFTGRLITEYFSKHYGSASSEPLRWAVAARSESKLQATKKELGVTDVPHIVADSADLPSLRAMVEQTEVIITVVGPYLQYGERLVEACANAGTHYLDLTGESFFIKQMIERHHDAAVKSGARIIHSCGMESIPADMGTYMVARELKRAHDTRTDSVTLYLGKQRGGAVSGGTVASLVGVAELVWKGGRKARAELNDPYFLVPEGIKRPSKGYSRCAECTGFGYDSYLHGWVAPAPIAPHDSKIVQRSNALLGEEYGPTSTFRFHAATPFPGIVLGFFKAAVVTLLYAFAKAAVWLPPTRWLLQRFVLPKSGDGPLPEVRSKGFFYVNLIGRGANGAAVEATIGSEHGDGGYTETAKMISECAVTLVRNAQQLSSAGGIHTPASALGAPLLKRLRAKGMVLEVGAPGSGKRLE